MALQIFLRLSDMINSPPTTLFHSSFTVVLYELNWEDCTTNKICTLFFQWSRCCFWLEVSFKWSSVCLDWKNFHDLLSPPHASGWAIISSSNLWYCLNVSFSIQAFEWWFCGTLSTSRLVMMLAETIENAPDEYWLFINRNSAPVAHLFSIHPILLLITFKTLQSAPGCSV